MELPPRNAVTWGFPTGLDVRDANADQRSPERMPVA